MIWNESWSLKLWQIRQHPHGCLSSNHQARAQVVVIKMAPKVSIGVCVRNVAATVLEAIESIIAQDYPHSLMEIIFVDDGSEDATLSIIQNYVAKMDMRAKVFHTGWQGLGPARNVVVDNAEGDYIVWVDGDMVLAKSHVRRQVEFIEAHPEIGISGGRRGILPAQSLIADLENVSFMVYESGDGISDDRLPGTGGTIFRVKALKQVGGFDGHIKGVGEDLDVAYRIKTAGWLIGRSSAAFFERGRQTWQELWKQYFWHGYGLKRLYRRNPRLFSIARMTPVASFAAGALHLLTAYKVLKRKSILLLPFHFAFKMTAWCLGFARGQMSR